MAATEIGQSTASLPFGSPASPPHLLLYTYWRSGCSWRVRIALNLKGIDYTPEFVNLLTGAQKSDDYSRINPSQSVPTLVVSFKETQQQLVISQSSAILEWLEETHGDRSPLFPADPNARAKVRSLAAIIISDTQPTHNLVVLSHLQQVTGKEEEKQKWAAFHINRGLNAFEHAISFVSGKYSFGDQITIADCCLIPQLYAARRFNVDVKKFTNIMRIEEELNKHPAFIAAHAENQPDNPEKQKK